MPLLRPRVFGDDPAPRSPRPIARPARKDPLSDIVNWIPVEVIAPYKAVWGQIPDVPSTHEGVIAGFVVLTVLWILFATRQKKDQAFAWRQAIVSAFAFFFWSIGTENQQMMHAIASWWADWMSIAALAIGTLCLPIIDGILSTLRVPQD